MAESDSYDEDEEDTYLLDIEQLGCCAIREINGLDGHDSALKALREIGQDCLHNPARTESGRDLRFPAFFIFSQAGRGRYGESLARLVKKLNLGELVRSERKRNPRTGNRVTVWLWSVNNKRMLKWVQKNISH